jgi:hypothetical protein
VPSYKTTLIHEASNTVIIFKKLGKFAPSYNIFYKMKLLIKFFIVRISIIIPIEPTSERFSEMKISPPIVI